jgi:hypothetical protein
MIRTCIATITLALLAGPALAQFPTQPPPASITSGNEQERAACHPDVVRFCKQVLRSDGQDDVFAILSCLQTNRSHISRACQAVLTSHGQ